MASARSQARSNLPRQDAEALAEEDAAKAAEAAAAKAPAKNEVAEEADDLRYPEELRPPAHPLIVANGDRPPRPLSG